MTILRNLEAHNLAIAKGDFPGLSRIICFGRIEDVDTGDGEVMVRPGTFGNILPSTAADLQVVSTSTDDSATGGGTSIMRIVYLDEDWVQQTAIVQLTGTTPVNMGVLARRIVTASGIVAGSASGYNNGIPTGDLTIVHDAAGTPVNLALISAGTGAFTSVTYTVPAGHRAIVDKITVAVEGLSKEADFFINIRANLATPASPFFPIVKTPIASEINGFRSIDSITNRFVVPEFTDIWLTTVVRQQNTTVEGTITVYEELL